jgi:hypothetical protein
MQSLWHDYFHTLGATLLRGRLRDPVTFIAVALVVPGSGLAACWFPAMRATRVDPVEALRFE